MGIKLARIHGATLTHVALMFLNITFQHAHQIFLFSESLLVTSQVSDSDGFAVDVFPQLLGLGSELQIQVVKVMLEELVVEDRQG